MSEGKKLYPVYAGNESYGFFSYGHTGATGVLPVIAALHRYGVPIPNDRSRNCVFCLLFPPFFD